MTVGRGSGARKMPKWAKAPEALVAQFERAIEGLSGVETRKMFGYPAAFMNGNMFSGLFQSSIILRLSESDRAACASRYGARPFEPMPGRPMREYIVLPDEIVGSAKALAEWLRKGHHHAASLPPKRPRTSARAARVKKR